MNNLPDPSPIVELIEAFRGSKAMFAAVSLGVFDHLEQRARNSQELAQLVGVLPDPFERLLDACVSLGLLAKAGTLYSNTPIARTYLCRTSPSSLAGYILYSNDVLFRLWTHLEDGLREGTPRWVQAFGSSTGIFDSFFRTEESRQSFIQGMHGFGQLSSPKVVEAFDLSAFRQMVDIGGATGHLAIAACNHYPKLRAVVFDLPQVIESAKKYIASSPSSDRVTVAAGDFFVDELPPGDLYALGRILHDWSEDKVLQLLHKAYAALPPGGAILLAEKLLFDDKSGPRAANLQSLNMLMCTEGKERSLPEYRRLLESVGFREVGGKRTGSVLDAVVAFRRSGPAS